MKQNKITETILEKYLNNVGKTQKWLLKKLEEKGYSSLNAPQLSLYVRAIHFPNNPLLLIDIAEICGLPVKDILLNFVNQK